MNIGKLVDTFLIKAPKYESVDAEFVGDGSFILKAQEGSRKVTYYSHAPITIKDWEDLGGLSFPSEETKYYPGLEIKDPKSRQRYVFMVDRGWPSRIIHIIGHRYGSDPPFTICESLLGVESPINCVSDAEAAALLNQYISVFRIERHRLDVRSYERLARVKSA